MLARELKPGQLFSMTEQGYVFVCLSNNRSIGIFPIYSGDRVSEYEGWNPNLNWEYGVDGNRSIFLVDAEFFLNGKPICS